MRREPWIGWKRHLEGARTLLEESGFVDSDIAWAAELGADQAEEMGGTEEALQALSLARVQWKSLGNSKKVREVEEKFTRIGSSLGR